MKLTLLVLFCALFPATHMLMSHGKLRERLVQIMGVWPFRGVYSLVSLLTLGAAVELYRHNVHTGPVLWELPRWIQLSVTAPLVFLGLQLLLQSLATPSPSSMMPARLEVRGVLRITRHPMNIGLASVALGHIIANGTLSDVVFFGAFFILGLFGPMHLDRRKRVQRGEAFAAFLKQTSVIPFLAILLHRNRLELGELSFPLALVAAATFVALAYFHGAIFGIALI